MNKIDTPFPSTAIYGDFHNIEETDRLKLEKVGIIVKEVGSDGLAGYNIIIIVTGSIKSINNQQLQKEELISKERDLLNGLRKGSHICLLCSEVTDPLFAKVLSKLSVRFIRSIEPIVKVSVKRSEFTAFLDTYANSLGIFTSETNFKSVICTVGNIAIPGLEPRENITHYQGEFIAGFTNELENGLITILPFFIRTSDYSSSDRLLELITKLAEALDTHKKNIISEPPQWIDEIKLKDEHEAQNEILKLKQQISKKEIILKKQQEYKSILWLKHNELRDVCTRVLDEIGIKTLTNDIGEEDFWILDLNNSVIAMAECKGKDHNIERRDLSLFDEHREARKKDESFPALLIVNTFNKANSLSEKDMPIPSNVIEKACRNNMLITRTLDLIMILNLFQKSMITKENIFEKITKHRGWMRVSDEGEVIEVITI